MTVWLKDTKTRREPFEVSVTTAETMQNREPNRYVIVQSKTEKVKKKAVEAVAVEEVTQSIDYTEKAEQLSIQHGIDLKNVRGTGKNGKIIASDIYNLIEDKS